MMKFFEKKEIKAGGKTIFKFEIDPIRDLSFPDATGKRLLESGNFYIHVGKEKIKIMMNESHNK